VLDPQSKDSTTLNPRRVTRGPDESTYKTLSAKRPTSGTVQSFKSPRAGKSIKKVATAANNSSMYISKEVDEHSTLSKMMEVSNQLLESKAKMMRHLNLNNVDLAVPMSDSVHDFPPDCTKIDLQLAL
jgi:hypothetical protein